MRPRAVCRMISLLMAMAVPFALARDASRLYDPGTLQQWKARYPVSTNKILNQVVLPALKSEELRRLSGVRVEYPLAGEGEFRGSPLSVLRAAPVLPGGFSDCLAEVPG